MRSVIFDTDIGIDDAMALLFLHCASEVNIAAITTRFGNASIDDTTRNALAVSEAFGIDAPVFRGAEKPLAARLGEGFPEHVHGTDGLGDIDFPSPKIKEQSQSAAEAIVSLSAELINNGEDKIAIIAVGGLTNIVLALELDPQLGNRIEEVIVMGGAFGYNGHSGNVSPVAEANIASDPLAADIVFTSNIATSIIGLDVTHEVVIDEAFVEQLAEQAGAMGRFIKDSSRHYLEFHKSISGNYESPLHDSCAVAYYLQPKLFETINQPVRVVTEGIAIGQTIHSNDLRDYVSEAWLNIPASKVGKAVNAEAVLELFRSTLINGSDNRS